MNEIKIGAVIASKRKEKGVTQEELAKFLGVSTPAVSKWERAQAFPDITLLPEIAAFFNITVDSLMGYEPQLRNEQINYLYRRLSERFATEPFDTVLEECRRLGKQYYSCYPLQLKLALLLVNHLELVAGTPQMGELMDEIVLMYQRILSECKDPDIREEAACLLSLCYLMKREPDSAVSLLETIRRHRLAPDSILAQAYEMKGEAEKAVAILQESMFVGLTALLNAGPQLVLLYGENAEKSRKTAEDIIHAAELFEYSKTAPLAYANLLLAVVQVCMRHGERETALNYLEEYTERFCRPELYPLRMGPGGFFDRLPHLPDARSWQDSPLPRDEKTILRSLLASVEQNPVLEPLKEEERFQKILSRLKEWIGRKLDESSK